LHLNISPPAAAEVLAQLRYDLPATYKFHKCVLPLSGWSCLQRAWPRLSLESLGLACMGLTTLAG